MSSENSNLREGDNDKEFRDKLKNPPKPINNTQTSPEMEEYLRDLNDPLKTAFKEENKSKDDYIEIPICPHCRRPGMKRTPQGVYCCGYCGLQSNSPSYIFERK